MRDGASNRHGSDGDGEGFWAMVSTPLSRTLVHPPSISVDSCRPSHLSSSTTPRRYSMNGSAAAGDDDDGGAPHWRGLGPPSEKAAAAPDGSAASR